MFLRDAVGKPLPPTDVVARLKRVDDRLGLEFMSYPLRDGPNYNYIEYWAITCAWTDEDKRRHLVQINQLPEGSERDVVCMLPIDCSVNEAFGYFEKNVRQFRERKDFERILSRVHEYNETQTQENLRETTELAEELIESNVGTLFKKEGKDIPKVYFSGKGSK